MVDCIVRFKSGEQGIMVSRVEEDVNGGFERWVIAGKGGFVKLYRSDVVFRLAFYDGKAGLVLDWLVTRMNVHNRATINMGALVEDIGCHHVTIWRKLKRLQELNFIRLNKDHSLAVADINPEIFNRSSPVVLHYFKPPLELPSVGDIDDYFSRLKKSPRRGHGQDEPIKYEIEGESDE
jgi:hypothetical protein